MPRTPIQQFTGVDNLNPEFNVPLNGMLEGENIYIDDEQRVKGRDGYVLQSAGNFHSIWNNTARDVTLVVQDDKIQSVRSGFALIDLVSGLTGTGKMSYVEASTDTVIYSNGVEIGQLVDQVDTPFVVPSESYKRTPVPGHLLAFLNARLYMASTGVLWFTDAYTYNVDRRIGFFQFKSYITLLHAVDDGLYVSDSERTYFVKNDPPSKIEVHPYPAIPYNSQVTHSERFSIEGLPTGKVVMWASEKGLVVGGNGGIVFNVTHTHYAMPAAGRGGGLISEENGNYQFVVNLFN